MLLQEQVYIDFVNLTSQPLDDFSRKICVYGLEEGLPLLTHRCPGPRAAVGGVCYCKNKFTIILSLAPRSRSTAIEGKSVSAASRTARLHVVEEAPLFRS